MKRKIAIAVVALAVLYFAAQEAKDFAVEWYFANVHERSTAFPSSAQPDHIVLTWSGDPKNSQAVNWRTSSEITEGVVEVRPLQESDTAARAVAGTYVAIDDRLLVDDPNAHRWTAELSALSPSSTYAYRVGNGTDWSAWEEFRTAPEGPEPFSFLYLGDPQRGLDEWGELVVDAYGRHPESAFCIIAGDLVNDGHWRNEWDELFAGTTSVFGRIPIVPCLGNHDVDDALEATLYIESFALPQNGPPALGPERAFSFSYGNAFFVVLDSNLPANTQAAWLEEQLASTDATWKFAVCHHPAYSSAPHRENKGVREVWGPLFDRFHVDMVLQGHDHAYLRTYPMRGGQRVGSAAEGTYYVVSVSGTKFYEQLQHDYAEVAFPEVMTYQVIDIETEPHRMTYRAYDREGELRDEVIIEK